MISFKNFSIRRKLVSIVMLTCTAALIPACAAFIVYDLITFRREMVNDLASTAAVIGDNSTAALVFNDSKTATEILGGLKAKPNIVSAGICTAEGSSFAVYRKPGGQSGNFCLLCHNDVTSKPGKTAFLTENNPMPPLMHLKEGHTFVAGYLVLFKQIRLDSETVGVLYIQSDLREIDARLRRYFGIVSLILLMSSIVAFTISSRLQRIIARPIMHLAETSRKVAQEKDYSIRAIKENDDELGFLVERFNMMLAQIQEAEDKQKQMLVELKRSNTDLQQFAYVASHDLQEPLRMVSSHVQLLERRFKDKLDERANESIGYAVDGAIRMQNLITDLLAYSRVSTRGKEFKSTECEEVLRLSLMNLGTAIEESGAEITHDELPTIMADGRQLVQLFQNLIGNAIKFRPKEGLPQIHISAVPNGGSWIFGVKDNGIGIDPQFFDRIFVIFQRLHTREEYSGTGIGLAVCARIVERHGGRIWVDSTPGKGTTFYFTIPKKEEMYEPVKNRQVCADSVG